MGWNPAHMYGLERWADFTVPRKTTKMTEKYGTRGSRKETFEVKGQETEERVG